MDEQAAELMLREQHNQFAQLARKADEEKDQTVRAGHRAQQEAERASQELQRVYHDVGVAVQHKDQLLE